MSTISVNLDPVPYDRLVKGDKIHHIVNGKKMAGFKIGDVIRFRNGSKSISKKIIGSEMITIQNRKNNFPLIGSKKGKKDEILYLDRMKSQNLVRCEGSSALISLIIRFRIKEGFTSVCKVLHFTDKKYF